MKTFATLATVSMLALAGTAFAQTTPPAQPQDQAPQAQGQTQGETQGQTQAQDQNTRPGREGRRGGPRLTEADFQALTDARMAAIQAGLKLNDEQQRLWQPVEQALRQMATARAERFSERRERMEERRAQRQADQDGERQTRDLAQNLQEHAQRMTQAAQRLTALSEAVTPFYASLSEDQKRLLPVLMRQGRGGDRMRMGMHHGGRGHHGSHHR